MNITRAFSANLFELIIEPVDEFHRFKYVLTIRTLSIYNKIYS